MIENLKAKTPYNWETFNLPTYFNMLNKLNEAKKKDYRTLM